MLFISCINVTHWRVSLKFNISRNYEDTYRLPGYLCLSRPTTRYKSVTYQKNRILPSHFFWFWIPYFIVPVFTLPPPCVSYVQGQVNERYPSVQILHARTHKEHDTIAWGLILDINNILVYLSQKDYLNHLNVQSR